MTLQQLQRITLAIHCIVTLLTGLLALRGLGAVGSLVVVAPLLALLPGIYRSRLARLRLASIVLVPYVTVAVIEVVANTEMRAGAALLMFGLLLELTLIIALIRGVQHRPVG